MTVESVVTIGISIIAVIVAMWQAHLSKQQLEAARDTERRTEQTLTEIRIATSETRHAVEEIKRNIDDRITHILDEKLKAEADSRQQGQDILRGVGNFFKAAALNGQEQAQPEPKQAD